MARRYGYRNRGKFLQQLIGYVDMRIAPPHVKEFIEKRMKNEKGEVSPQKVARISEEEVFRNFPFPAFLSKDYGKSALIIRNLDKVSKELDKKFGNKFVCIQLIGSRSKGSAISKSDMEYGIVTNNASYEEQQKMSDLILKRMTEIGMDPQGTTGKVTGIKAVWEGNFAVTFIAVLVV